MTSPTAIPPNEPPASAIEGGVLDQPRSIAGPAASSALYDHAVAARLEYLFRRIAAEDVPVELRRALYQYRGVPL